MIRLCEGVHHNDPRDEQFDVIYNIKGPPILKMEIQNTLKHEIWQDFETKQHHKL